mmetsp:Transcript_2777/g.8716  ORF Transcript_2777/g.8716 Transcript_2777/m.8716 type:complete len:746 (-) Transcript_2777:52-2289(-)|eukprot:CAMPEP_0174239020 /NCGR_PEP_ID=MMETSP0417-20130205/13197_1 /TAXON_ID=242541 /ORGANISM="Mayorella sp, Strain BSH-02190019" /LENGTH=745 /DNA_ID=CAMNT_0015317919 /DNA_START=252 /DNA_END=2489 /DNA_ORIENTATION=-
MAALERMAEDESCALKGFLLKQGERGLVKLWKKRWFALHDEYKLYYFTASGTARGYIDLRTVVNAHETPDNLGHNKKRGEWVFQVNTPRRVYYLLANSEANMQYWVNGITDLVSSLKSSSTPAASDGASSARSSAEGTIVKSERSGTDSGTESSPGEDVFVEWQKDCESKDTRPVDSMSTLGGKSSDEPYEYGHMFAQVHEVTGIAPSHFSDCVGVYCIMAYEKQEVKTTTIRTVTSLKWNEGFSFDVSDLNVYLCISVWAADQSVQGGRLLGDVAIPVSEIREFCNQERAAMETTLKLTKVTEKGTQSTQGSIRVKLSYEKAKTSVSVKDFDLLKVVGRGNFGKVMQVRKVDTGRVYAMKVLRKDAVIAADAIKHTLSESAVLRRIRHPFIVNLKYAFQSEKKLYMILDYLNGGELFFHLSTVDRFTESRARFYAAEIVMALGYLHENNVIYRDLKPENLLLDMQGHCCLTDFGLVKENLAFGEVTRTICGSPEYLAPEILLGRGYNKSVDWWALGTFLYEMLEGLPPFYHDDVGEMNRRILSQPLYFSQDHFTKDAQDILRRLLDRNPETRLGSGRFGTRDIKDHPFFKPIDWDLLYQRRLTPEFKPHLQNPTDVRYFDPEFTSETPKDSFVESSLLSETQQLAFNGFSYVAPSLEQQMAATRARRRSMRLRQGSPADPPSYTSSSASPGAAVATAHAASFSPLISSPLAGGGSTFSRQEFPAAGTATKQSGIGAALKATDDE